MSRPYCFERPIGPAPLLSAAKKAFKAHVVALSPMSDSARDGSGATAAAPSATTSRRPTLRDTSPTGTNVHVGGRGMPRLGRTVRLDRNVRDGELLVHTPARFHLS